MTLAWYFRDEADAAAAALTTGAAIVPAIWPLEVANALVVGERRGRSTEAQAAAFLARLAALPIAADRTGVGRHPGPPAPAIRL